MAADRRYLLRVWDDGSGSPRASLRNLEDGALSEFEMIADLAAYLGAGGAAGSGSGAPVGRDDGSDGREEDRGGGEG